MLVFLCSIFAYYINNNPQCAAHVQHRRTAELWLHSFDCIKSKDRGGSITAWRLIRKLFRFNWKFSWLLHSTWEHKFDVMPLQRLAAILNGLAVVAFNEFFSNFNENSIGSTIQLPLEHAISFHLIENIKLAEYLRIDWRLRKKVTHKE